MRAGSELILASTSESRRRMLAAAGVSVRIVAPAADMCVEVKAADASAPEPSALPALKPNQPIHSSPAPMALSTRLCGTNCGPG